LSRTRGDRTPGDDAVTDWLTALEARHLADLTLSEVARALRALSSCYVERRAKLASGEALGSRGKRAAFALFYGPMHLLVTRAVVRALPSALEHVDHIVDLGCGTGAAGAAWALEAGAHRITGFDRHPWAVAEANATYRHFSGTLNRDSHRGHSTLSVPMVSARQRDIRTAEIRGGRDTGILAAYAINELAPEARPPVLEQLLATHARGAQVLIIEPIARRALPWWPEWQAAFEQAGGRADEWRFPADLPKTQQALARAAGLDPRELTARSLWLP
jgi:SAM-dependent methyltransferase